MVHVVALFRLEAVLHGGVRVQRQVQVGREETEGGEVMRVKVAVTGVAGSARLTFTRCSRG